MDLIGKSEKVLVTPEIAKKMLENHNNHNRKISKATVNAYAEDMRNGKWVDNNIPITYCIDTNSIADGQHSLSAVVESGISQYFIINYLPSERCKGFDMNRIRSVSDILTFDQILEANMTSNAVIAIANVLLRIDEHGRLIHRGQKSSAFVVETFIHENEQLFEWWLNINHSRKTFRATEAAAIIAAYKCGANENAIKAYVDFMYNGYTNYLEGKGWYQVRDKQRARVYPFSSETGTLRDTAYDVTQFLIHCAETNRTLKIFRDNMFGKTYYNFNEYSTNKEENE